MLDLITIHILRKVRLMEDSVRNNICEVEILPEFNDALNILAELYSVPKEAVANKALMNLFAAEYNAMIDFHHHCGCGEYADVCYDENYEIGRMNIIRNKLKPYENGLKCICCGDDMNKNDLENQIRH
jgi:hypothetical protein